MFRYLSDRLQALSQKWGGQATFTPENMKEGLREVRIALLEADVALPVVKSFIDDLQTKLLDQSIDKHFTAGQALIKEVHDALVRLMGEKNDALNLASQPPAIVLMLGLQGAGKTTTAGKLAHRLIHQDGKKVMMASLDIYRPAAIEQLKTLCEQTTATFFPSTKDESPLSIAKNAIETAKRSGQDVLILDTAGRLHIDDALMQELKSVAEQVKPVESLLVLDSMMGQDALAVAQAFCGAVPVTGFILTKIDGDARGGAALSLRHATQLPIKFMGVGEKLNALEAFYPDRIASRILGMGDMLSLIEEVEQKVDKTQAEKAAKKFKKGSFDLEDFLEQLQTMKKMGGMNSILSKLPGGLGAALGGQLPAGGFDDQQLKRFEAIIYSMTPQERRFPDLIRASRKRRIALGSGTDVPAVNQLLKQFMLMQKMAKKFGKNGGQMEKMMRQMKNMPDLGSLKF